MALKHGEKTRKEDTHSLTGVFLGVGGKPVERYNMFQGKPTQSGT